MRGKTETNTSSSGSAENTSLRVASGTPVRRLLVTEPLELVRQTGTRCGFLAPGGGGRDIRVVAPVVWQVQVVLGQSRDASSTKGIVRGGQELRGEADPVGDRVVGGEAVERKRVVALGQSPPQRADEDLIPFLCNPDPLRPVLVLGEFLEISGLPGSS